MGPKIPDRLVTTCRACRRRKIGCDRQRPACRQCRASNISCVYERQGGRAYHFIHETPSGPSAAEPPASSNDAANIPSPLAVPEQRMAALESRVKSLSDVLKTVQQSSSSGTSPLPASAHHDNASDASNAGYLSDQGSGKMRYVNASSWSAMCRDAAEIDDILYSQSQGPSSYDADTGLAEDDESYLDEGAAGGTADATDSLVRSESQLSSTVPVSFWAELPPRDFCDFVLKWYFRGYHPLIPLVHIPSFSTEYEQFWIKLGDRLRSRSSLISFTALLLSLLYAGSVVGGELQSRNLPGLTQGDTVTNLYRLTGRALKLAKFPYAPTLDTLRAYLILKSIRMREEEPLSCVAFVGLSLRVANMLGLHKDPKHFPQFDIVEGEVRRRVWWQLVHIDVCVAVAAGLPPLIDLQSWDVQPLSELKDELIGTPIGTRYEDDVRTGRQFPDAAADPRDATPTSMVSTSGILAASKYHFTVVQRRFLLRLESGFAAEDAPDIRRKLEELAEHLQQAVARIPGTSRDEVLNAGLDTSYGNALVLNKWARLLISTYLDQRLCLISSSLRNVPNWQEWEGLHADTIEASMSFLIKCAQLSTDTIYHQFQWSWPGNHQPLHALVVLLNELLSSSDSAYADRIGNVVDAIFALVSDREGFVGHTNDRQGMGTRVLVRGGSEVWKYLRRLRARAWRKKGWDPAIVLSRDEAIKLCQDWFVDGTHSAESMLMRYNPSVIDEQSSATNQEATRMPSMGLFEDDFLYQGDMELPDITTEIDFFGGTDEFSLEDL